MPKQQQKIGKKILLARAKELVEGGRAVISNLCIDERGWYYSSTDRGASLYSEISDCMRSMVSDGLLTPLEFEWATSPEYYRTIEEMETPFKDPNSPVRRAGLLLESAATQITRCPLREEWLAGKFDDPLQYGRKFAYTVTSFTYNKLARAFEHEGNQRSEAERKDLLAKIFERLAQRVAANPEHFGIDTVSYVMVLTKTSII